MQASSKPLSPCVHEDKQPAVATFKNSLRVWQAQYKAQRATRTACSQKRLKPGRTCLARCRPLYPHAGPRAATSTVAGGYRVSDHRKGLQWA
jgi:hypothetical protein